MRKTVTFWMGFHARTEQARSLERLAAEQNNDIVAVLIDVPCELLEQRMTGRRNCPVCNEIYNIYFKPPRNDNVCDLHPEVQLVQRADDNSQTVRSRLATYEEQTRPLVEYYKAAGLLHTVDGTREPEAIYDDVVRVLPQISTN
jgi:adenylate kinase